jgi:hypothetical protein
LTKALRKKDIDRWGNRRMFLQRRNLSLVKKRSHLAASGLQEFGMFIAAG